jgi:hypothetical protein
MATTIVHGGGHGLDLHAMLHASLEVNEAIMQTEGTEWMHGACMAGECTHKGWIKIDRAISQ